MQFSLLERRILMLKSLLYCSFLACAFAICLGRIAGAQTPSTTSSPPSMAERLDQARQTFYAIQSGQDRSGWEAVFQEFLALAKEGEPEAQETVARMYGLGRGTQYDDCAATYWADKAARAGRPWAQTLLGGSYMTGSGVFRDYEKAYIWYKVSARNGRASANESAQFVADLEIKDPIRVAKLDAEALKWRAEEQPPVDIIRMPDIWGLSYLFITIGITPCHFQY